MNEKSCKMVIFPQLDSLEISVIYSINLNATSNKVSKYCTLQNTITAKTQ